MKKSDVLIIGSGISGLFAACVAADAGKKVQILSYGAGTLTIGGGIIDVLGYTDRGKPVEDPLQAIDKASPKHPYAKVGSQTVKKALETFLSITASEGFPYIGSPAKNQWLPTAIGNFKPTCLVPRTMDTRALLDAENILVVGFDAMKDFYTGIAAKNIQKRLSNKNVEELTIKLNFEYGRDLRDISAMDVARWLETKEGRRSFIDQVKGHLKPNTAIVLPPVLGLEPDYNVLDYLEEDLECHLIEVSSLPPAVTGIRLSKLLTAYAKKHGVQIIEKAHVTGADIINGRCQSVITESFDRKRKFYADQFILATGGVYGGGIIAKIGAMVEPIFNINIDVPKVQTKWSHVELFANKKQIFAQYGVNVNDDLTPVTADGSIIASNVKVVGRSLAGYDFCYEKSGNGVALATAYKAAAAVCGEA